MRSRRTVYILLALLFLLMVSGRTVASWLVEILWFQEVGYAAVFWRIFLTRITVGVFSGLLAAAVLYSQVLIAGRNLSFVPFGVVPPELQRLLSPRRLQMGALAFSLLLGGLTGVGMSGEWELIERFRHGVAWHTSDPVFGRDVGFYIFELPFYRWVLQAVWMVAVLSLLVAGVIYLISGAIQWGTGGIMLRVQPRAITHLAVLIALLFLLKSVGYWLDMFDLVHSTRGRAYGAGYTDIHARLPALRIMAVLALASAAVSFASVLRRNLRPLALAVGSLTVASILLGAVWPALVQRLIVQPNEQTRERPYLEYNIAYTRQAFGLADIEVREFEASNRLTADMLQQYQDTIDNIRLWDVRPLGDTYRQRQNIRQYYDFHDIDVDRYTIGGRYIQTLLAARELDHSQLEPGTNTWTNLHLRFTHGYGVVMSPAARVGAGGQPEFFIQDIPPRSPVGLEITRPEIYFGELQAPYAVVRTRLPEIDHPSGDTLATTYYDGNAGIPIGNLFSRLLFSIHLGDYNLLLSSEITPESRILIHRQIISRVTKIAPFLQYDGDPYLVISDDGRLFWMVDGYTISRNYPYSEPYRGDYAPRTFRGINYIRNSVKVIVDAYNGDVRFYIFDDNDPLIQTYSNIFPSLFKPADEMPADLRSHARYPEDLFRVQADVYTRYHMTDPDVFYSGEDVWELPQELLSQEPQTMDPYYLIMRLEDEAEPEFLLMLPFTPATRPNMVAWMAGRSDGDRLGQLFVFQLPKDRQIFGPMQVENRINQQDEIAQNLALWSRQGTTVIRGSLLVIPIGDTLLYVEPLYLRSTDGGLPELRRVIVAYGDHEPVMERTLTEALARLVGADSGGIQAPAAPEEPGETNTGETITDGIADESELNRLLQRANQLYEQAMAALRRGDFAAYGEYIEELGSVLKELIADETVLP